MTTKSARRQTFYSLFGADVDYSNITRFAITHIDSHNGLRRLTCSQQGKDTWATKEDAEAWLEAAKTNGLQKVLSPEEMLTVEVMAVECYHHGDPIRYYY